MTTGHDRPEHPGGAHPAAPGHRDTAHVPEGGPGIEESLVVVDKRASRDGDDDRAGPAPGAEDAAGGAGTDELAVARAERDEYLDMLRRVQADFENYKKRVERQQVELRARAAEHLVTSILPALDAFELARTHLGESTLSDDGKALLQAASLLNDALAKEGLEQIGAEGDPFDPTAHDAVEHLGDHEEAAGADVAVLPDAADEPASSTSPAPAGPTGPVVAGILRPGYRWKGRVLRPAMVRVRG